MAFLRRLFGIALVILYALVVTLLTINTWADYAGGIVTLSHAILQSTLILGAPLLPLVAFAGPEAMFHSGAWVIRKLTRNRGSSPN